MFESVNALSKRLPQPSITGEPAHDARVREQIMANAKLLRNEAFACMVRALAASVRQGRQRLARLFSNEPSPQT